MSQKAFSENLDVSQSSISHYETGRRSVDKGFADSVIGLCRSKGLHYVDYNYIFGEAPQAERAA